MLAARIVSRSKASTGCSRMLARNDEELERVGLRGGDEERIERARAASWMFLALCVRPSFTGPAFLPVARSGDDLVRVSAVRGLPLARGAKLFWSCVIERVLMLVETRRPLLGSMFSFSLWTLDEERPFLVPLVLFVANLDVLVVMMLVMGAHGTSAESTKTVKARLDVIDILFGKIDLLGGFASDVIDASRGVWGFASDDCEEEVERRREHGSRFSLRLRFKHRVRTQPPVFSNMLLGASRHRSLSDSASSRIVTPNRRDDAIASERPGTQSPHQPPRVLYISPR